MMYFVCLETRVSHVYDRREEDVEQEGRRHAPLTKALSLSETPRAHPVVESHVMYITLVAVLIIEV